MLLNEGGGDLFELRRRAGATASAAARRGSSASSSPPTGSPATRRCRGPATTRCSSSAPVLSKLADRARVVRRSPTARPRCCAGWARTRRTRRGARADRGRPSRRCCTIVEPMLGVTLTPTMAHASDKMNVIPSRAQIRSTAACRPASARTPRARRIERGARRRSATGSRSSSPRRVVGNQSPSTPS